MDLQYRSSVNESISYRLRIVAAAGAVLITAFSGLDAAVYPELTSFFFRIRLVESGILLLCCALALPAALRPNVVWLSDVAMFSAGAAISLLIYFADGAASSYYQGLHLVLMALLVVNPYYPAHVVGTGLLILACYFAAVFLSPNPLIVPTVVSAGFFVGTTLFFVALFAKLFGRQHQQEFLKTEELREANVRLRESERLKDDFLATVSHELRTPLTLIFAPIESLLRPREPNLAVSHRRELETVRNNAVRLLQMVNSLLDFARTESETLHVQREAVDAPSLTELVLSDFDAVFKERNITADFASELTHPWRQLDRYLYERILFNLLSNAAKFTNAGGRISVRLREEREVIIMEVSDSGIGIREEELPKLFDKFYQVEQSSTRRFEGTGLGLSLVHRFALLLDGDVTVESTPGEGTTFQVRLCAPTAETPAQPAADRTPQPVPHAGQPADTAPDKRRLSTKGSVLIAEDNPELADFIAGLLEGLADVTIAPDGEEALRLIRSQRPDLLLADVMMPRRDGLSLCRAVKNDQELNALPVILLTALTHREALLKGWEAGADEYLFKPFHPEELLTRVSTLLNSARRRADADTRLAEAAHELAVSETEIRQFELFSSIASHDLREPVRTILMYSELIQQKAGDYSPEELAEQVDKLRRAAARLWTSLEALGQFSNVVLREKRFDSISLREVVQDAEELVQQELEAKNGRIDIGELPEIVGDRILLRHLFLNLFSNSLKFAKEDTPPHIEVRGRIEDGSVVLKIRDNGVGFDPEYAESIFEPFKRLHTSEEYPGTGLGLAICYRAAVQHYGSISASSIQGAGTTFTVILPLDARPGAHTRAHDALERETRLQ